MTHFLSKENIQGLIQLSIGFLRDKHNLNIASANVAKAVEDTMKVIASSPTFSTEQDIPMLNKRVILSVRDRFMLMRPLASSTPPQRVESTIYDVPTSTKTDENEDDFFKKLQSLELSRKAPPTPVPVPVPVSNTVPPLQTNSVQPSQPITVIVPSVAVSSSGVVTRIHSRDRDWMYHEDIHSIVWNGPLPKQTDETNFRVVQLLLPKQCLYESPYVILRLEGAGGQHQDVYFTPNTSLTGSWVSYTPCCDSNSYVKRFSLPWTLRLLDAQEKDLILGKDAWLLENIEGSRLTLVHSSISDLEDNFQSKDRICLKDALGNEVRGKVLACIHPKQMEVLWEGNLGNLQAPMYCMNECRQWTLFMESQITSHTTKK
jgi:hypothetical protein